MSEVFEIRTAAQLRVFNTPATRDVFEAMLDLDGSGAGEIGAGASLSAESAHYHLKKLMKIGLVRVVAERETGARPEKVFGLTSRRVELLPRRRGPAYVREVVRGVRLMLRRGERDFERASVPGAFETRPRISKHMGWLTAGEIGEVDRLESELAAVFQRARESARLDGDAGRERVAVTMVLAPVDRVTGVTP